jgi:hypothetical protein
MIAKLRVGWMVAGCAPGVRTITSSALFHCNIGLTVGGRPPTPDVHPQGKRRSTGGLTCGLAHTSMRATAVLDIDKTSLLGCEVD